MQINGTKTIVERALVEVDPEEVINQLQVRWKNELPDLPRSAEYINHEGVWESWENTHGSGITRHYRSATEDEIVQHKSFAFMREQARKHKFDK